MRAIDIFFRGGGIHESIVTLSHPVTDSGVPAPNATRRFKYIPALDGLRGIAVLLVLGFHGNLPGFKGGWIGVDIFFVLSGFLITVLLLEERAITGGIALRSFYMRRVLRLVPALLIAVIGVFPILILQKLLFNFSDATLSRTIKAVPYALTYTMNLYRSFATGVGGLLGHTWSLAMEEQFYLAWPLAVIWLGRRENIDRRVIKVGLVGAAISMILRVGAILADIRHGAVHDFPLTRADGLLLGCALAGLWVWKPIFLRHAGLPAAKVALLLIGACTILSDQSSHWGLTTGLTTAVVAAVVLTAHITYQHSTVTTLLEWKPLVEIGRRSYGLYLYHWPIFMGIGMAKIGLKTPLAFASAFAAAWISYALVERRFLAMKDRWAIIRHDPGH